MRSKCLVKAIMIAVLILVAAVFDLSAFALDGTGTYGEAMGRSGLSLALGSDSFFANPALLASQRSISPSLITHLRFADDLVGGRTRLDFERPLADGSISFLAKNLALTIQSRTLFDGHQDYGSYSTYEGSKQTLFELDWAWGSGPISLGFRAQAVARSERADIRLNADQLVLDYLVQSAVATYQSVEQMASISFGMGLLLDYEWIAMGVVVGQFAASYGEQPLVLDGDSLFKSLGWGLSLSSPAYTAANDLHLFRFQGSLDLVNLGSDESRQVRMGVALTLQLLADWSVSLLSGYREVKKQASDLVRLSPSDGLHTVGLVAELGRATVLLCYEYPTAWYTNVPSSEHASLSLSLSITL